MALEKNTTLIFNDVWQDIEDNLETEHEKARMLDIMVAFYLHGEIPAFGKAEGERIVKVVFAGMKRGAEYNNKKYEDSCYRALDKKCGNKARDYGLYKPDGKTGDIRAFIERYPEEYQKLRVETKVAEIEGDEAAVQSENVPERVHKSGHIEETHEEETYEEPFVDEEPEEPEEPTREEPYSSMREEEPHEEEPKKEPPKEENSIEAPSLNPAEEDMLNRYKKELKPDLAEKFFEADMQYTERDLSGMEKMLAWRRGYYIAQDEIFSALKEWKLIFTDDNFDRLKADEVEGFINDLIEAKKPLEELLDSNKVIDVLVSLKYDIEKVKEFTDSLTVLLNEYTEYYGGEGYQMRGVRARLSESIYFHKNDVFKVLNDERQRLEILKKIDANKKKTAVVEEIDEVVEELPFV